MPSVNSNSPWGKIQHVDNVARGINIVSTAGHGGAHLSKTWLKKMHPALVSGGMNQAGWFEEDCEILKVVCSFPEVFKVTEERLKTYKEGLKYWFPQEAKEAGLV